MANIKTTLSLPESLFAHVEKLAREMKVSRSRVFVLALESFVRDYQDGKLFEKINEAYSDEPQTEAEQAQLREIRRQQRRWVESEW